MKLLHILKNTLLVIAILLGSISAYSITPKNYIYDTQEENGLIIAKTVYVQDNHLLDKQMRFEFSYNKEGKVVEKKAFRWNKSKDNWQPFYLITYTYQEAEGEIHSTYGMWNEKKKDYSLNLQELISPLSDYEEIFS